MVSNKFWPGSNELEKRQSGFEQGTLFYFGRSSRGGPSIIKKILRTVTNGHKLRIIFCDDLSFDVVKEVLKERIIIVSLITASFVSNVSGSK